MPQISVIIPAYNASLTIGDTINSVLKQTFSDFELIIINDGSTDSTLQILNSINDPKISVYTIQNSGPSAARNKGIELARGEFISFIDADDLWSEDKLEKQLSLLLNDKEYSVAYSLTIYIDEDGKHLHPMTSVNYQGNVYPKIILNNFVGSGSNILVRKSVFYKAGVFNAKLTYGEEWDLLIRLSRICKFAEVKEHQIFYRQNLLSLSSSIQDMERDIKKIIDNTFKHSPEEFKNLKSKSLSYLYSYISYLYLTRQNEVNWKYKSIVKSIYSIKLNPLTLESIKTLLKIILVMLLYLIPSSFHKSIVVNVLKIYGQLMSYIKF